MNTTTIHAQNNTVQATAQIAMVKSSKKTNKPTAVQNALQKKPNNGASALEQGVQQVSASPRDQLIEQLQHLTMCSSLQTVDKAMEVMKQHINTLNDENTAVVAFTYLENSLHVLLHKERVRAELLAPVNVDEYRVDRLSPLFNQVRRVWTALDTMCTFFKGYGNVQANAPLDNVLQICKKYVQEYNGHAATIWEILTKIEKETRALNEQIKRATVHPHSTRAKNTNVSLYYVGSIEEDEEHQRQLEANKQRYQQLQKELWTFQEDIVASLIQTTKEVVNQINWLCYQYEYKKLHGQLPHILGYYTVMPVTVINPFLGPQPSTGAVVVEKQNTYMV